MDRLYIGLDTSCYTTSVACVDDENIILNERTMLNVKAGERGLRQSDAVFQHVLNLKKMIPDSMSKLDMQRVVCVAVSSMPRDREDSYMPVFVAGHMAAAALSAALQVPLIETSHQQGHISAALIGNSSLRGKNFIAVHLSGGTTELLSVDPDFKIVSLGGTRDINAGQLVDRIGVELGCGFPAGPQLEKLAIAVTGTAARIPSSVSGTDCSFSGAETFARKMIASGEKPEETAYAVFDCISRTIAKLLQNAANKRGIFDVLLAGGVASSTLLKTMFRARLDGSGIRLYFAQKGMSGDNAAGNAVLAREWAASRLLKQSNGGDER